MFSLLWLKLLFDWGLSIDKRQAEDMAGKDHRVLLHLTVGSENLKRQGHFLSTMSQSGNAFWKMSKRWPVSMVECPKMNYNFFHWDMVLLVGNLICSVQSLSCVRLFATPWTAACQASLSITNSQSLLKLMSIKLVMPSNHLFLCHPLLLLPSIFPSIRVFYNESVLCIRWPKCWNFSFSISPSNEYSGFISFRMDWLDLLAIQGTLKGLLQHHSSKALIL